MISSGSYILKIWIHLVVKFVFDLLNSNITSIFFKNLSMSSGKEPIIELKLLLLIFRAVFMFWLDKNCVWNFKHVRRRFLPEMEYEPFHFAIKYWFLNKIRLVYLLFQIL